MFGKKMVRGLLAAALATMLSRTAMAEVILPTGLAPGSEYQLAFVTSGATTATNSNISFYNSFVTQQAAENPLLPTATWKAIVSTTTVNANANALAYADIPIYNTQGQLVASGSAQLWSGYINSPILYDQNGSESPSLLTWTGSEEQDGTAYPGGIGGLGSNPSESGWCFETDYHWLAEEYLPYGDSGTFYALSSPITVIPEPSTLALLGVGAIGLLGYGWRRRKRTA